MIVVTGMICRLAQKYAQMQHPLIGRSGRRLTVGPGHARTGTQIARFGATPGGYLAANQVADH